MVNNLIYDVGMHNGNDTGYYLYRGFKVIAIEANPIMCSQAKTRFARNIETGQLQILNIGIDSSSSVCPFWICESVSEWSSFDRAIASRNDSAHHAIDVQCQTFRWVLDRYGVPYYLKIDIEGNDELCIDDLHTDDLPAYVSFEGGPNTERVLPIIENLKRLGFNQYKCISQLNYLPLQFLPADETFCYERWNRILNRMGILGRYARKMLTIKAFHRFYLPTMWDEDWQFTLGSSGPFGERTAGRWHSYDEMVDVYCRFVDLYTQKTPSPFWSAKDFSFWVDFHAKRGK